MAYPTLQFSKNQIYKAGKVLIEDNPSDEDLDRARNVLGNWRACHGYPINTFNATLKGG